MKKRTKNDNQNQLNSSNHIQVSIVIPTYNRKEMLLKLIESITNSNIANDKLEIIIIDDLSEDDTSQTVAKKFGKIVKIIRNSKKLNVSASRNIGIRKSIGKYILILDDDNVLDKKCISNLLNFMNEDTQSIYGIIAPIMFYYDNPKMVWCAGIERNMYTSFTTFIWRNKIWDNSKQLIASKDFPNAFMIRREALERVDLMNEKTFPIHYEEADFGERVRLTGYKIACVTSAKLWHKIPSPHFETDRSRLYHCHNKKRAYYSGRNRIIFHKKYSTIIQFIIYLLIFNQIVVLYYTWIIISSPKPLLLRLSIEKSYLVGILNGYFGEVI